MRCKDEDIAMRCNGPAILPGKYWIPVPASGRSSELDRAVLQKDEDPDISQRVQGTYFDVRYDRTGHENVPEYRRNSRQDAELGNGISNEKCSLPHAFSESSFTAVALSLLSGSLNAALHSLMAYPTALAWSSVPTAAIT